MTYCLIRSPDLNMGGNQQDLLTGNFIKKALLHGGYVKAPWIFCQTFMPPKSVKTFKNAMLPDYRRFVHSGKYETSASGGLGKLFT